MVLKILLGLGTLAAALVALRVAGRATEARLERDEARAREAVARRQPGEDYVRCGTCGDWRAAAEPCACGARS